MPKSKDVGFTGTVEKLKLQDVIQMACIAGTTSTITAFRGNQKGYVYISAWASGACRRRWTNWTGGA